MRAWNWSAAPLIAAAITVLAAGCASGSGSAALSSLSIPEEHDITVAALPTADLAGLYIAQDDGFFAQQHLHVKIEKIASSAASIAEQENGQVDITAGSYVAYIAAQAAGARFRILAEASALRPDTRVLVIPTDSPIKSLTGLVGKKIALNGTNSIGTLLISALLAEYGISPAKVTFVTDPGGFPVMPAELQDGAWAAAFLAEPYVTLAERTTASGSWLTWTRARPRTSRSTATWPPRRGWRSTRRRRRRSCARSRRDRRSPTTTVLPSRRPWESPTAFRIW